MNEGLQPGPEQETAKRVFVEIGHGAFPSYFDRNNQRDYFANTDYIGIDIDPEAVDLAKQATGAVNTEQLSSIGLNQSRFHELALEPDSVDEVYMANVFAGTLAAQDVAKIQRRLKLLDLSQDSGQSVRELINEQIDKLDATPAMADPTGEQRHFARLVAELAELRDKLKPSGQLTIVETNTPTNPALMREVLAKLGFEIVQWITPQDQAAWDEQLARYHIPKLSQFAAECYIVHATPIKQQDLTK